MKARFGQFVEVNDGGRGQLEVFAEKWLALRETWMP